MYNKITIQQKIQPQPQSPTDNISFIQPSFSRQPQPHPQSQSQAQQLHNFIRTVSLLQQIHNIGPKVVDVLLMNCGDVPTVEEALRDSTLTLQIRERMAKYLRVVDFVTIGHGQGHEQVEEEAEEVANFGGRSQEIMKNKQIYNYHSESSHNKPQPSTIAHKTELKNQKPELSASRYNTVNSPQAQNTVSIEIKKYNKSITPTEMHGRSVSHSQVSESGKKFHKIQLKSVKRMDRKEGQNSAIYHQERQQKHQGKKQQKKKDNPSRRYTISQRQRQKQPKCDKTLSNQVHTMKTNSRLSVSRVTRTNDPNPTSTSTSKQKARVLSKSKYRPSTEYNEGNRLNMTHSFIKEAHKNMVKEGESVAEGGLGTNLVIETVQKSNDFLLMLKMMNQ